MQHSQTLLDSIRITPLTEPLLLDLLVRRWETGAGGLITYATADTLLRAATEPNFARTIDASDLCYTDGMGVVLASKMLAFKRLTPTPGDGTSLRKVTASAFYPRLFELASEHLIPISLIGATDEIVSGVADHIASNYPNASVPLIANGYNDEQQEADILDQLSRNKPGLVLVGMGQPRQEAFGRLVREASPGSVVLCVGGLFDLISGHAHRCHPWFRDHGLEWSIRLAHNPRRLWKRYLIGLPRLACLVALRKLRPSSIASPLDESPDLSVHPAPATATARADAHPARTHAPAAVPPARRTPPPEPANTIPKRDTAASQRSYGTARRG